MTTHLSPERLFVLRLALGAFVLIAAASLFGGIAEDVVNHDEPLGAIDLNVGQWLHEHATPTWTSVMLFFTVVGAPVTVMTIASATAIFLFWRRQRYGALLLAVAVPGGLFLNFIVKLFIHRHRPIFDNPLQTLTSYSFPSGHAAGSTLLFGALAGIVIWQVRDWRVRALVPAGAALLIALICFSRIYLGVHYLSDVIAGVLEGVVWLGACLIAIEALRRRDASGRRA
jgi:membrane-associated phospholipid phosphatase